MEIPQKTEFVRSMVVDEEMRRWQPAWTRDEMNDDDLRVLYTAFASSEVKRPEWRDVTFESLGCKYYHGEWNRL